MTKTAQLAISVHSKQQIILGDVKQCTAEIFSNLEPTKSIKDEDDGSRKSCLPVKLYAPTTELNEDMMQQLGVTPTEPYEQENELATKRNPDTHFEQIAQKKYFRNSSCPLTLDHREIRFEDELSGLMQFRNDF
ncbi:hypothetical protein DPMN_081574 [Dreissena polymorpha]|uniref:Uncharacterized protein n=1 Tax=Dreissena polymorpha TaxID=45954 RepID=A0A9D4BG19_DREPO|nr:hypothetical protein DPMN_081574 [Dreissena polymorpha]